MSTKRKNKKLLKIAVAKSVTPKELQIKLHRNVKPDALKTVNSGNSEKPSAKINELNANKTSQLVNTSSNHQDKKARGEKKPIIPTRKLFSQTIKQIWRHKRIFVSMFILTIVLNVVFVKGFSAVLDLPVLKDELQQTAKLNNLQLSSTLVGIVAGSGSSGSTEQASVYQSLFMFSFCLAYIWLFRSITDSPTKKLNLRLIFYNCMTPIVQFLALIIIAGVQLIPLIAGLSVFTTVQVNGLAVTAVETTAWGILALAATLLSFYLIVPTTLALFIVTVPDMTPMRAYKKAKQIVKGGRLKILQRIVTLIFLLILLVGAMLMLIVVTIPVLAEWLMVVLSALAMPIIIGAGFRLYRSLLI